MRFVGFSASFRLAWESRASLACGVGLALALATTGCDSCNEKALQTDANPTLTSADGGKTVLTPELAAKVLAKVGDRTITLGDYVAALDNMDQFDRLRYQSTERRKELLDEMITVELLAQEAKSKGYDKDPATQEEIRSILRDAVLAEAKKDAPTPGDIPEADVHAYYDAHQADYRDPERRRISLIVTKDEPSAKEALAAALKSENATDWGQLVRTKSVDNQAKANVPVDLAGDFGIVSPPGDTRGENPRVPEEVRAAAFQIAKPGDVLDHVVQAASRYYVVRYSQKLDPHTRSYQEAERTIRIKLAQEKAKQKEASFLADLKKQYPVVIDDAALASVHVDLSDAGAQPSPQAPPALTTDPTRGGAKNDGGS